MSHPQRRDRCLLSTCLCPWPGTGVLKVCFWDFLWVCEIKVIFPEAYSQDFLRLPHNVWHHSMTQTWEFTCLPVNQTLKKFSKNVKQCQSSYCFCSGKYIFFSQNMLLLCLSLLFLSGLINMFKLQF